MANIELIIIQWLNENGHQAFADVPNPKPTEFVTVEKTGGGIRNVRIGSARVAVQCWSTSRYNAARLADTVISQLDALLAMPHVRYATVNSLFNFPDADGKKARYQIVLDVCYV